MTLNFTSSLFIYLFLAHELWTTLRGDGVKGPFYVQSKSRNQQLGEIFSVEEDNAFIEQLEIPINPVTRRRIRPGEAGMLAYMRFMFETTGFYQTGDLILADGEKAFDTPVVQEYFRDNGLYFLTIQPAAIHALLSPCDNHFHSLLKLSYYRALANDNHLYVSLEQKFALYKTCYDRITAETIVAMFRKCGLIDSRGRDKRGILLNLLNEGLSCLGKYNGFHRSNLLAYLEWCRAKDLPDLAASLTSSTIEFAFGR